MVAFERACERVYNIYRMWGFPGIGSVGDTGEEWVFVQAPEEKNGELPIGEKPKFINKETGEMRTMVFDVADMELLNNAAPLLVPDNYKPKYAEERL